MSAPFALSLRGPMIRINVPWLIETIEFIDGIDSLIPDQTVMMNIGALIGAQVRIEQLFGQSIYGEHLRASRQAGTQFHELIVGHANAENWAEKKLDQWEVASLRQSKSTFKTVLLADLGVSPTYLVTRKDNFDVGLLIDDGVRLFPAGILLKAPEIEKDAKEVGRALAYELPTACGFHTFRVTESVVRRYWDQVSEGKERPKLQTLGNFASEMEKQKFGDERVVESLKQMTKLHRNPLIHPEVILTIEEANGIIGMARSVIAPMLQALPDVQPTTGAPSSMEAVGA